MVCVIVIVLKLGKKYGDVRCRN